MFNVDQSNFPLPAATLVPFGVLSAGQHVMKDGGVHMKTATGKAWLFATTSEVDIADTEEVRLIDVVMVVTPFTE